MKSKLDFYIVKENTLPVNHWWIKYMKNAEEFKSTDSQPKPTSSTRKTFFGYIKCSLRLDSFVTEIKINEIMTIRN